MDPPPPPLKGDIGTDIVCRIYDDMRVGTPVRVIIHPNIVPLLIGGYFRGVRGVHFGGGGS